MQLEPVIVWRIEAESNGLGPFVNGHSPDAAYDLPGPREDPGLKDMWADWRADFDDLSKHRFGFADLVQYSRWFDFEMRAKLALNAREDDETYWLVQYITWPWDVQCGDHQIAFRHANAHATGKRLAVDFLNTHHEEI